MHKPLINNRRLNDIWSAQANELMIRKLQGVKPHINSQCPESFVYSKTQLKKTGFRISKFEQLEIAKNNETLLRKLLDVNIERNSKINKNKAPVFSFKKNFLTGNKKYDIIKIAQENQSMLKRLNERSSFYDVNKWEKEYQMNQYYKRSHCIFPSIDFKRSNSGSCNVSVNGNGNGNGNGGTVLSNTIKSASSSPKQGLSAERRKYNNSYSNFGQYNECDCNGNLNANGIGNINYNYNGNGNANANLNDNSDYIQINEESHKELPKILYRAQAYLGTLGSCTIDFAVQVQNFTIKIESVYEKERVYGIIFDSRKSVENIQRYYRRYEDMINQLEYDEKNDIVKFNNLIKKDLVCRCIKLPPKTEQSAKETINKSLHEDSLHKVSSAKKEEEEKKVIEETGKVIKESDKVFEEKPIVDENKEKDKDQSQVIEDNIEGNDNKKVEVFQTENKVKDNNHIDNNIKDESKHEEVKEKIPNDKPNEIAEEIQVNKE